MLHKRFIKLSIAALFLVLFAFNAGAAWAADPVRAPAGEKVQPDDVAPLETDMRHVKGLGGESAMRYDGGSLSFETKPPLVSLNDQPFNSEPAVWTAVWLWLMLILSVVSLSGYLWISRQGILARWRA
jgi:hypothetical protein